MKNLSLLTALTLLMYTGCESLNENEVTLDDPELQALSEVFEHQPPARGDTGDVDPAVGDSFEQ